jgi:hypothetical protein
MPAAAPFVRLSAHRAFRRRMRSPNQALLLTPPRTDTGRQSSPSTDRPGRQHGRPVRPSSPKPSDRGSRASRCPGTPPPRPAPPSIDRSSPRASTMRHCSPPCTPRVSPASWSAPRRPASSRAHAAERARRARWRFDPARSRSPPAWAQDASRGIVIASCGSW